MKTDKVIKQICVGLMAVGGMLITASSQAATATTSPDKSSATITIPVTITNILPTCDLKLNGQNMVHPAFTASIECPGNTPVKTAITAALASGGSVQNGDENIRLNVGNVSAGSNTPLLWLQNT